MSMVQKLKIYFYKQLCYKTVHALIIIKNSHFKVCIEKKKTFAGIFLEDRKYLEPSLDLEPNHYSKTRILFSIQNLVHILQEF